MSYWQSEQTAGRNEWITFNGQECAISVDASQHGFRWRDGFDPDIDRILNLCLPTVPEIDPDRTAPTELAGTFVGVAGRSRGLSTEKPR
jgi:hypothetical protein